MSTITKCALALLLGGGLASSAVAQTPTPTKITSIDNLQTGWYQIKSQLTDYADYYVVNSDSEYLHSSGGYALKLESTLTDEQAPTSFVYITRTETGSTATFNVSSSNGHYLNSKAISFETKQTDFNITPISDTEYFSIGDYWTSFDLGDGEPRIGASYNTTNRNFELYSVDVSGYDIYTVTITGAEGTGANITQRPRVTCNSTANKGIATVYNGGKFFVTAGESLTESDLTPATVDGYDATVTITEGNQINVTYTAQNLYWHTQLQSVITEAETAQAIRGVGYPLTTGSAYTNLSSAIATARTKTEVTALQSDVETLQTALDNYKGSTTDIQMPEAGKAYALINVAPGGQKSYMNYTGDAGYSMIALEDDATLPLTATFICVKDAETDTYTLVNNEGKYLAWKGKETSDGYNSDKGYTDAFETNANALTIGKMVTGGGNISVPNSQLFGYSQIIGKHSNGAPRIFIIKLENGALSFDRANTAPYFGGLFSSAFLITEVSYPTSVKLNAAGNIEGIDGVGTYSAPYAFVLPEDVTAYTVETAATGEEGEEVAQLKKINGSVIPASTGVILAGTAGTTATLLPATDETPADAPETNLLGHSAGAAKTIAAEDNAYILTGQSNSVYLKVKVQKNANETNGCYFGMSELTLSNSQNADQSIGLTFQRTGTAASSVTVTATNSATAELISVVNEETGATINLFDGSGSGVTSGTVLCPRANICNPSASTDGGVNIASLTFKIDNLPASYNLDQVGLKVYGLNASGNFQNTSTSRLFDIEVLQGSSEEAVETPLVAYTGTTIVGGSTGEVKTAVAESPVSPSYNDIAFYSAVEGSTLGMNKAYLSWDDSGAATIRLAIAKDETTAIEGVTTETAQPAAIYDLAGRRVLKATKGLYIVNGKKVYVK